MAIPNCLPIDTDQTWNFYFEKPQKPKRRPAGKVVRESLLKGVAGADMSMATTAEYRPIGTDTLTIGNPLKWVEAKSGIFIYDETDLDVDKDLTFLDVLKRFVCSSFSSISDVEFIYLEKSKDGYVFQVFINRTVYDDALMDRLLDKELIVLKQFEPLTIDFRYLPLRTGINPDHYLSFEGYPVYQKV
jgi:hypothetical protein